MLAAVRAGWWAWVHDPNGDYTEQGPMYGSPEAFISAAKSGRVPPIARFRNPVPDLLRLNPETGDPMPGGLGWFATEPAPTQYDPHARRVARPTLLLFDEGISIGRDAKTERQILRLIARRRHYGLGLIFLIQWPGGVDKSITRMATSILCFRTDDEDDLRTLARRGVPRSLLPTIASLPPYKYVEIDRATLSHDVSRLTQ